MAMWAPGPAGGMASMGSHGGSTRPSSSGARWGPWHCIYCAKCTALLQDWCSDDGGSVATSSRAPCKPRERNTQDCGLEASPTRPYLSFPTMGCLQTNKANNPFILIWSNCAERDNTEGKAKQWLPFLELPSVANKVFDYHYQNPHTLAII